MSTTFKAVNNNQILLGGYRRTDNHSIIVTLMRWNKNYWIVPYVISKNIDSVPTMLEVNLMGTDFQEKVIDAFLNLVIPNDTEYTHYRGYAPHRGKKKRPYGRRPKKNSHWA